MNFQHSELARGRWKTLPFVEQMANIGSEIERTISWRDKSHPQNSRAAFYRALELLYFTIDAAKGFYRLRELTRTRELLIDHFVYDNVYKTTDQCWQSYFGQFTMAAAIRRRQSREQVSQ